MSITCVVAFGAFSLFSALVGSPSQLEGLRFLTGLGLGGGLPLAVARAFDLAPEMTRARQADCWQSWLVRLHGWPAIFYCSWSLPLAIVPLLIAWLPESRTLRPSPRQQSLVAALFQNGSAPSTVLLWAINGLSLLGTYFILLWTPAILHSAGSSLSQAI
jgi:MFS family permease